MYFYFRNRETSVEQSEKDANVLEKVENSSVLNENESNALNIVDKIAGVANSVCFYLIFNYFDYI